MKFLLQTTIIKTNLAMFVVSIFILIVCQSYSDAVSARPQLHSDSANIDTAKRMLEEQVDFLEFRKMPLARMFYKLANHLPISREEIEFGNDKVQPVKRNNITINLIIDRPEYSREFRNKSYQDILDELVSLENYFWEISSNGVINVLPRGKKEDKYSQSVLNSIIPRVDIEDVELQVLFSIAHPFGRILGENNIIYIKVTAGKDTIGPTKVSVHLKNATVRECLNAIVKAAGDDFYWTLDGWKRTVKVKGKKVDFRLLSIGRSSELKDSLK